MRVGVLLGAAGALLVAVPASAATVTLEPNADTYVNGSLPDATYGSNTALRTDDNPAQRSFLLFDVSTANLAGYVVKSARLKLYANSANSGAGWTASALAGTGVASESDTRWDELPTRTRSPTTRSRTRSPTPVGHRPAAGSRR